MNMSRVTTNRVKYTRHQDNTNMTKYVVSIANKAYFTKASGYDRQYGVPLNEASVLRSEDEAVRIQTVLYSRGYYNADILRLDEVQIVTGDAAAEVKDDEQDRKPVSDSSVELSPDDDMTAVEQSQEIEDDELDIGDIDLSDEVEEDEEQSISQPELEQMDITDSLSYVTLEGYKNPNKPSLNAKSDGPNKDGVYGDGSPKPELIFKDRPYNNGSEVDISVLSGDDVNLPSNIKQLIAADIKRLQQIVDDGEHNSSIPILSTERAAVDGLTRIQTALDMEDKSAGYKEAQLIMAGLMSPIQDLIDPDIQYAFMSGRKSPLKLIDIWKEVALD